MQRALGLDLAVVEWAREEGIDEEAIRERITQAADAAMAAKAANLGPELMRYIEKSLLIQVLDQAWKEHLLALDHLRQGIGLRAYGQRDPLNEYKSEAFALFNAMLDELRERVTAMLARVELSAPPAEPPPQPRYTLSAREPEAELVGAGGDLALAAPPYRTDAIDPDDPATWSSVPRNASCPCGSGKKFKHCHGRTM